MRYPVAAAFSADIPVSGGLQVALITMALVIPVSTTKLATSVRRIRN